MFRSSGKRGRSLWEIVWEVVKRKSHLQRQYFSIVARPDAYKTEYWSSLEFSSNRSSIVVSAYFNYRKDTYRLEVTRMPFKHPAITVTGDVCVDWLRFPTKPKDSGLNWELYPGTRVAERQGGALLLSEFLRRATGATVFSPTLEEIPPERVLHSNVELDFFPYSCDPKEKNKPVYRVRRFLGFTGPVAGTPGLLHVKNDNPDSNIVVLDDAGNGFREEKEYWPKAIMEDGKKPVVIYNMSLPLAVGKLWDHVRSFHSEKLVLVVNADDLRASGVNISRCLSWERTALDFVWQMASNPALLSLANCSNIVVRFGLEGAIHYTRKGNRIESCLYFDPTAIEDGFKEKYPGEMQGLSSLFVAALTARIADSNIKEEDVFRATGEGVRDGLLASRRLFKHGFGNNVHQPDYPGQDFFSAQEKESDNIADILVPNPTAAEPADPTFWCILKEIRGAVLEDIAYDFVIKGENAALRQVPVGHFGKLKTVDRAEIESFRSIKNLVQEYVRSEGSSRPLSIAVFGSPGSGKSFGVTEVASSIAPGLVVRIDFNVSQFRSTSDLISAFHRVRDLALEGKIPLVFFDEFDTPFDGKLGWLKHFLSPMQDGIFREGETVHPIGKSIFVFAGGVYNTFANFSYANSKDQEKELEDFRNAKGPDFVSRLRGYVNILGPNPVDDADTVFIIRRAMLLRSLLERKARNLFDGSNHARIDRGVLRALVKVPRYRHGARSIEAVIEMSMLSGHTCWEQAFLPAKEQLKLHVDEAMFSRLVVRDVLLGAAREALAKAFHEKYLKDQEGKKHVSDPSMQSWDELSDNLKESNRRQADHIPEKLRSAGCGFAPVVDREPVLIEFTPQEVEIMAELEHERWVSERLLDGWVYGEKRNVEKKISPYLVPWNSLTDDVKEWDRQPVRELPRFLAQAKFEIYRLH
jgi:hypothetical protein